MKLSRAQYLKIITAFLAVYYLVCGISLHNLGYYNGESLFYIEKARLIFEGLGDKFKVIGLTSPLLPFYATFPFTWINVLLAPVMASALGTALLFYIVAGSLTEKVKGDFYLSALLVLFLLHPGILYMAASGKGIYLVMIFFYMFFLNIFKYYKSNTTFHISIASLCLVMLIFCDYKFIWLALFFIPLVFFIAVNSLNLGEKESIFRVTMSFNNPSLRRKLINKTFAVYIILFILPIASVICYKLLNQSNASDMDYFNDSPYATWTVLAERLNFNSHLVTGNFITTEMSLLISAKMLLFAPLVLVGFYLFKQNNYQLFTLLTPFAFVEFLHVKYEKVPLFFEYYMLFIMLSLLCISIKAPTVKKQTTLKVLIALGVIWQIFASFYYQKNSLIADERNFITLLLDRTPDEQQNENKDMAAYINGLPDNAKVLIDDAIAYPVVAFTGNIKPLTLPYQGIFLSAVETPWTYDKYVLVASAKNQLDPYTVLNARYGPIVYQGSRVTVKKVYETANWVLYKLL